MLEGLNDEQREAALCEGHAAVVAVPGSGKTKTMAVKATLIVVSGKKVVATSFTRESARELRERIEHLCMAQGVARSDIKKRLKVGTFDSLCLQLVKHQIGGRAIVLDREPILSQVLQDHAFEIELRDAAAIIEKAKGSFDQRDLTAEEIECSAAYDAACERRNVVDVKELIRMCLTGFEDGTVRTFRADHLLVDEYQDTDDMQYRWVAAHVAAGVVVTVVGDDDQCQPGATLVETQSGPVRLDALQPGQTAIRWEDPPSGRWGYTTDFQMGSFPFEGAVFKVYAGGRTSIASFEHRWIVRDVRDGDIRVCTMLDAPIGQCEVPIRDGLTWTWCAVTKTEVVHFSGLLWSLDVKPSPYYVADGIVTHNSIYGFRRAMGNAGFERFLQDHRGERIVLGRNYRSLDAILAPADRLIKNNQARVPKTLIAARGDGGSYRVEKFSSRGEEAEAAISCGAQALQQDRTVAILARQNRHLDHMEGEARARGVPFIRMGKGGVFSRLPVKEFFALCLFVTGEAGATFEGPLAYVGMELDDRLALRQRFKGVQISDARTDLKDLSLSEHGRKTWTEFVRFFRVWGEQLRSGAEALALSGMGGFAARGCKSSLETEWIEIAVNALSKMSGPLQRRIQLLSEPKDEDKHGIVLATLHGSKGLEWHAVWIMGCESGSLPDEKSALEEERRLMYVGMTRAKNELVLSYRSDKVPSQFIAEAAQLAEPA